MAVIRVASLKLTRITPIAPTIAATRTIKPIVTQPGKELPTGTCKFCYAHRVRLTHNVKYPNGQLLRVCLRCAVDNF